MYGRLNSVVRENEKSVINQVATFMRQTDTMPHAAESQYQPAQTYQAPTAMAGAFQSTVMPPMPPAAAATIPPADMQYVPEMAMPPQPYNAMPAMNPYYSRGEAHSLDQYSTFTAQNQASTAGESTLQPQVISRGFVPKRKKKFAPPAQQEPMPSIPEDMSQYYSTAMYMAQPNAGPPFPPYAPGTRPPPLYGSYYPYGYYAGYPPHPDYHYPAHYSGAVYGYPPAGYQPVVPSQPAPAAPPPVMASYYSGAEQVQSVQGVQIQFQPPATQTAATKGKSEEKKRRKKGKGQAKSSRERSNSDVGGETKKEEDVQTKHVSSTDCSVGSWGSFDYEGKTEEPEAEKEKEKEKLAEKFGKISLGGTGPAATGTVPQPDSSISCATHRVEAAVAGKAKKHWPQGKKNKYPSSKVKWVPKSGQPLTISTETKPAALKTEESFTEEPSGSRSTKGEASFITKVEEAINKQKRGLATDRENMLAEGPRYKATIMTPRRSIQGEGALNTSLFAAVPKEKEEVHHQD